MPGDARPPDAPAARDEHPRSDRATILNPIYLLVCELAAARGLSGDAHGRALQLSIGEGWWAELSTSALASQDTMPGRFLLRLRRGPLSLIVDPFTVSGIMGGFDAELMELLRLAIHAARLSRMTGRDDVKLIGLARLVRDLGFEGQLLRSPDRDLCALGTLAFYVPRDGQGRP